MWGHGNNRRIVFSLDPKTAQTVGAASVHVASVGGRAAFSWAFHGAGIFEVNASIPHGERAKIELLSTATDDLAGHMVTREGAVLWRSDGEDIGEFYLESHGVEAVVVEAGKAIVSVGSGQHFLTFQKC